MLACVARPAAKRTVDKTGDCVLKTYLGREMMHESPQGNSHATGADGMGAGPGVGAGPGTVDDPPDPGGDTPDPGGIRPGTIVFSAH